jgi:hypothetical protein
MELLAVFANTAQVLDIAYEGEVVRVVTTGGTEFYSPEGELLDHDPSATAHVVEAAFEGGVLRGHTDGTLEYIVGEVRVDWDLGCPILDIDEEGGIACLFTAYAFGWRPDEVVVPATATAPGAWGLANGGVLTDEGIVGRVPGRVTALEPVENAWFVGTADGLYRIAESTTRLTPAGQICGNFITGTATFNGQLVVSTFDQGACRYNGQQWEDIPLPTTLTNDVAVHDGALWFATSEGLVRSDGQDFTVVPTQNPAVTDIAVGERLWATDLVGPMSFDGRWRRHRYNVYGTSFQTIASCGEVAVAGSEDAGLTIFNGRRWQQHDANSGLPDDWVMATECLAEDIVWAGLYDDGLWGYDGHAWFQIPVPDSWILSLAHDTDQLYVGTMGGLFTLDQQLHWTPDPRVHSLVVEGDRLYAGTEGGLAVYAITSAVATR